MKMKQFTKSSKGTVVNKSDILNTLDRLVGTGKGEELFRKAIQAGPDA